jgi:hypothetical protein
MKKVENRNKKKRCEKEILIVEELKGELILRVIDHRNKI